jgi:hypothetical protein
MKKIHRKTQKPLLQQQRFLETPSASFSSCSKPSPEWNAPHFYGAAKDIFCCWSFLPSFPLNATTP